MSPHQQAPEHHRKALRPASLPAFLAPCFHDHELSRLDPEADASFVIERVLATGDREAIRWLVQHYDRAIMQEVLRQRGRRRFDPRRLALWCLLLDVEAPEPPPWPEARAQLWPSGG